VVIRQMIEEIDARRAAFSVVSDKNGAFTITAFVPDSPNGYEVRQPIELPRGYIAPPPARDSGEPWIEQNYLSFPGLKAGESRHAEFKLLHGAVIAGEVFEPGGEVPASGVSVYAA